MPDSTAETLYVLKFAADGTPLPGGPIAVAQIVNNNPADTTHRYSLQDPKIGFDANVPPRYTVAWRYVTQVDPIDGADAAEQIQLYVAREGGTVPPQLVAQSYLDAGPNGFGDPSSFRGDRVVWPDLDTNASGQSVVVWARMVNITGVFSEYMALDAVNAQRVYPTGALNGLPFAVSQNAHTYEPNAVPLVAMNDAGAFVVSWTYIPDYNPQVQPPVPRGIYARLFMASGTSTNEFLVVPSPDPDFDPHFGPVHYYVVGWGDHPVGMDAAGNFVVGYDESTTDPTSTLPSSRVRVQAYNADGSLRGGPVDIATNGNPFSGNSILDGAIQLAMAPDGTFVAAGIGVPPSWADEVIVAQLLRLT
jgi:hypothetical protein